MEEAGHAPQYSRAYAAAACSINSASVHCRSTNPPAIRAHSSRAFSGTEGKSLLAGVADYGVVQGYDGDNKNRDYRGHFNMARTVNRFGITRHNSPNKIAPIPPTKKERPISRKRGCHIPTSIAG
jgi:hypothetical protein